MSNCGCSPSGYPSTNNECCTDVAALSRFAYSSAQSAFANAENAKQSAEDAATTLANAVLKTGSTMTGLLELSGNPVVPLGAATKQYVDTSDSLRVLKTGDTMTGLLVLSADPSAALGAATKQYVDNTRVAKAGDTMTGTLNVIAQVTANSFESIGAIESTSPTAGIGYAIGAGASITQTGTKASSVTLNNICGQIVTANSLLNAGQVTAFNFINSTISQSDIILVNTIDAGWVLNYEVKAHPSIGSALIVIKNISGGALSDAITINFAIIKAVN